VLLLELFIGALSLSPSAVAQLPLLLIYGAEYSTQLVPAMLVQAAATLTQVLLLPIDIIAFTLLYYDHRVRREALDLQLQVQRLMAMVSRV
ncbi:MAG: hypothetical protein M3281_01055, partial [Chloroflexota bacterium]|nr:hypothetical protein [Chloroflexota bacterium]